MFDVVIGGLLVAGFLTYLTYPMLRPERFSMTAVGWLQAVAFFAVIALITRPLGAYMALVFASPPTANRVLEADRSRRIFGR